MGFDCIYWITLRGDGSWSIVLDDGTEIEYIPAGGSYALTPDGGYWIRVYNTYDPSWYSNNSNPNFNWANSNYDSVFQCAANGAFFVQNNSTGDTYYFDGD